VYVRKQIVHNIHVLAELREQGAVFVDELDEVPGGAITPHGANAGSG
jgi:4-hydroxy-3-methylbut-2-enyl diphosphate reductase